MPTPPILAEPEDEGERMTEEEWRAIRVLLWIIIPGALLLGYMAWQGCGP
jgi:hypothetical protein